MSKPYHDKVYLSELIKLYKANPKRIERNLNKVSKILDELAIKDGIVLVAVNVNTARGINTDIEYSKSVSKIIDDRCKLRDNNHKYFDKKLNKELKNKEVIDWNKVQEVTFKYHYVLSA